MAAAGGRGDGALAVALGLALRRPLEPARPLLATRPAAAATGQQVQFTTDNGTLVVWVLQPRPVEALLVAIEQDA